MRRLVILPMVGLALFSSPADALIRPKQLKIRVMTWNIQEGDRDRVLSFDAKIPQIASEISALAPDIVLLNEMKNRAPNGSNDELYQIQTLSALTGMPYYGKADTTSTGWTTIAGQPACSSPATGLKAVGVLSNFPILSERYIPITNSQPGTSYGTYEVTVLIKGVVHHFYSTRWDSYADWAKYDDMNESAAMLSYVGPTDPVIFGGDLNSDPTTNSWFTQFGPMTGMTSVFDALPDTAWSGYMGHRIDHIFFRGYYHVTTMLQRCELNPQSPWTPGTECPATAGSDHPWVFAELTLNSLFTFPPCTPGATFLANFQNMTHFGSVVGASGNDCFQFSVPTGYTLDSTRLSVQPPNPGESWSGASLVSPFPASGSTGAQSVNVNWWYWPGGAARYQLYAPTTCH